LLKEKERAQSIIVRLVLILKTSSISTVLKTYCLKIPQVLGVDVTRNWQVWVEIHKELDSTIKSKLIVHSWEKQFRLIITAK